MLFSLEIRFRLKSESMVTINFMKEIIAVLLIFYVEQNALLSHFYLIIYLIINSWFLSVQPFGCQKYIINKY